MIRSVVLREFGLANLGLSLVWFVSIIWGLIVMLNYETRPGPNPRQLTQWPADSLLQLSSTTPTVFMFTHPHCPCTRASIAEWERVISRCRAKAEFNVIAFEPANANAGWQQSDLVCRAAACSDGPVFWDKEGREARRFNVSTSGHVVMYDPDGRLRFSGGITGSRGHEGANLGRSLLVSWLLKNPDGRAAQHDVLESPVFGCPLMNSPEDVANE